LVTQDAGIGLIDVNHIAVLEDINSRKALIQNGSIV